jgi:hypothetical protein
MAALDLTYEQYVEINGGEHCGICGKTRDQLPDPTRKLDRDHDHITHEPRGLLCRTHNRQVKRYMTVEWVEAVLEYLSRRIGT